MIISFAHGELNFLWATQGLPSLPGSLMVQNSNHLFCWLTQILVGRLHVHDLFFISSLRVFLNFEIEQTVNIVRHDGYLVLLHRVFDLTIVVQKQRNLIPRIITSQGLLCWRELTNLRDGATSMTKVTTAR